MSSQLEEFGIQIVSSCQEPACMCIKRNCIFETCKYRTRENNIMTHLFLLAQRKKHPVQLADASQSCESMFFMNLG